MRHFRDRPITQKLTLIIVLAGTTVLVLACAAFVAYDQITFRQSMVDDLKTSAAPIAELADVAVAFADEKETAKFLSALKFKVHIVSAAIFTTNDVLLAKYEREGRQSQVRIPAAPGPDRLQFEAGNLILVRPIFLQNIRNGTLYIQSDLEVAHARLKRFSLAVAAILTAAVVTVLLISSKLQRLISEPILELAETARLVAQKRNYGFRVKKRAEDEVGDLVERFNDMLSQIEAHEKEMHVINEQLAFSEKKALAATQAKSAFLANMSHELRTPLTAIIGFSEMLLHEARSEGRTEQAEDLMRINDSAGHLLGLINDILDLSKIEAQKMDLRVEEFRIEDLIRDVTTTLRQLISQKSNSLEVVCPENIGSIRADQVKVKQCLLNLLSNANKFTDKGRIKLVVSRQSSIVSGSETPAMDPGARATDTVTFTMTDTGIGMSVEQIAKLFQAFSQVDDSTSRKSGGTGLGLTITKHFCEMMGGTIIVHSEPGKGSTFVMELPVEVVKRKPTELAPIPLAPLAPSAENQRCLLVIDDDPNVHRLIERTLQGEGFTVRFAADGKEGLRLARELRPRVITLDVLMPETDGWSVLSALKSDPELSAIPVIMLTIIGDKDLGFSLGASDYLVKPIDRNLLMAVLRKYVGDLSGGQVLVVEDDAGLRDLLRRTLETEGWAVVEAANGLAALESLQGSLPAVILLDLMLPVLDGFQVLAELHKREAWRQIPVVVLTAKDLSTEERQRLAGQTQKILEKGSYVREELLREVRNCVERFRSA